MASRSLTSISGYSSPPLQQRLLWNMLVLVTDWTRHNAPRRDDLTMRQFTPWACAIGGFLEHHGIKGFLSNVDAVRNIDEQDAIWT